MLPPLLTRISPSARLVLSLVAGVVLAGCGGAASDSQVAARVNKGEISIHQVQTVMQRQPRQASYDAPDLATARVLEMLIEQELAAQAGRDQGVDKDPRIIQAIEAARRELVALAYQERIGEKVVGPTSDEIDRYYAEHPELFSQRRLYLLQETRIDPEADPVRVQAAVERAQSPDELYLVLREAGIRHSSRMLAQAAEDLPLSLLAPMAALEPGRSTFANVPGAPLIVTVVQSHRAPIDRRTANNAIASYLLNERRSTAVADAMKKLREQAKIEYLGNFARRAAPAASAASQ
jgi:EpsD family peptidyl-prolyl cis-trans isomerase